MRWLAGTGALSLMFVASVPAPAFAAGTSGVVPEWLSIVAGAVGLGIAVILLIDAYSLKRVAEGSMVAVNIAYMISAVVCFAMSMILRWMAIFSEEATLVDQSAFAADLLVTAGMALLAVYFLRVRMALSGYLRDAADLYAASLDGDESKDSDG